MFKTTQININPRSMLSSLVILQKTEAKLAKRNRNLGSRRRSGILSSIARKSSKNREDRKSYPTVYKLMELGLFLVLLFKLTKLVLFLVLLLLFKRRSGEWNLQSGS